MPSKSKAQRKTAGMARAIQKGEMAPVPGSPSAQMAKSMESSDLREFATTKEKGLPQHVKTKNVPTGQLKKRAF
jgi:hypothetical protein